MFLKKSFFLAAIITLVFPVKVPAAEDEPDLSRWRCRFCPFETGLDGEFGIGIGLAFDDAYRFGNGTGLGEDGIYLDRGSSLTKWGENARFFEVDTTKLGTRARSLMFTGGVQGRYVFHLGYDQSPYRQNNTGMTPFLGLGSANLTLPAGWRTAGSTRLMPDLAGALRPINIGQDRKNIDLGVTFFTGTRWTHEINFERQTREGLQAFSGSFLTLSSILPAPIDYETDIVQAAFHYTADQWQARLSYDSSRFTNNDPLITWQNPFNPITPDAVSGVASRPPDNDFQQVSLSANYRFNSGITLVGNMALGKASQDALLAPYTSNALLTTSPLPATSADGRIDSTHINAAALLNGRWGKDLRYKAFYRKHERDNQTPARDWQPVVSDVFVGGTRRNAPFSFDKTEYGASIRHRLPGNARVAAGVEREEYWRDLQEVSETNENSYWLEFLAAAGDFASASIRVRRDNRNGSGYRPVSSLDPPENPLLRKYNLADRDRDQVSAQLSVDPRANINLSLLGEYAKDAYPDSVVGLKESEDRSLTFDASYQPVSRITLHGFLTRQTIDYALAGNSSVLWSVNGEDRFITGGLNIALHGADKRKRLLIDYTRSDSRGTNAIAPGSGLAAFPDLTADLETFSVAFTGQVRDKLSARLGYQYERYHSRDWQIEGVTPTVIGNVLAFGEALPNYSQQIVWLGVVRSF